MGRKPNPLILEYFERGPKLNDNSNRYPHTCRLCGENFPKGRSDSLTAHITKRCPAISESERMRACLELHGIAHARTAAERHQQVVGRENASAAPASSTLPQEWSALETLAEASRQVDLNENNRSPSSHNAQAGAAQGDYRFHVHGHYTLENPPASYEINTHDGEQPPEAAPEPEPGVASLPTPPPLAELTPEERLQALLPASNEPPENPNISVAVAAAARLNSTLFDPQLVSHDHSSASPPAEALATSQETPEALHAAPEALRTASPALDTGVSQPWGEMTHLTTTSPAMHNNPPAPAPLPLIRGGVRMDTMGPMFNGRSRHFRSKFTPARRQEVKEVRKLGACIRCRILRKICSKGTPCDTCRKVLAPRVWMTGCVRSRLHEQLDLYSAGVQVVLSQNRINLHRDQLTLTDVDSTVQVSHFPDTGKFISLPTLAVLLEPGEGHEADADNNKVYHVIMVDQDKEDVPDKVDAYVRDVLELFVEREPSRFMRITLETAMQQLAEGEDELLRKALELWGLVESIDRERQWTIVERPAGEGQKPRPIKEAQDENDVDIYTMICMQLNAAAERKANGTSKALLNLMDRLLADSKTKAGFKVYLTALILLNCVEKSTWAFKAWESCQVQPQMLERDPGAFTQQGGHLAALFKMLLGIRHALPHVVRADDGKLATLDPDPAIAHYFQTLDLEYDTVQTRQKGSEFSPADSRSLELMFCSHLLLPNTPS
ncbi:hypothetical protein OCS_06434 [Ophiocordyceps sinensis CO18]|uniref:Uncharacterized protein n=1 Tax=Ophiocordyceps sinensis (strain Co18 / CGMCC 3.14243) TaxID=911162 RepID=T5A5I3_OPHSC|nr:hypothetical protein OCS_06434 [Ophiocordyceps sinensis CO18]